VAAVPLLWEAVGVGSDSY